MAGTRPWLMTGLVKSGTIGRGTSRAGRLKVVVGMLVGRAMPALGAEKTVTVPGTAAPVAPGIGIELGTAGIWAGAKLRTVGEDSTWPGAIGPVEKTPAGTSIRNVPVGSEAPGTAAPGNPPPGKPPGKPPPGKRASPAVGITTWHVPP